MNKEFDFYVASSWRNKYQALVVKKLRESGYSVYDFRNPEKKTVFHWSEIDANWKDWNIEEIKKALQSDPAQNAFESDYEALERSRFLILVLPCGLSAHLEAGYFVGSGKAVFVYAPEKTEVELMYTMFTIIEDDIDKLIREINDNIKRWSVPDKKSLLDHLEEQVKDSFDKP